ncbi:hypothetical protein V2W45_1341253 [Cenococcum geophilum]
MTSADDGKEYLVCTAELVGPNSKSVHFAWIAMRGRLRCLNWRSINGHHARHPEVLGEPVLKPNCHGESHSSEQTTSQIFSVPGERGEFKRLFQHLHSFSSIQRKWSNLGAQDAYGRLSAGYLIGAMRARTQAGWSGCGPDFGFNPTARMRRCKLERLLLPPPLIQLFPKPAQQFSQTDTYRAIPPSGPPSKPLSAPRRPSS